MFIKTYNLIKLAVVLWLVTGASNLAAQTKVIDSLKMLLPGALDSDRAHLFYELAYEYVDYDNAVGRNFGIKAFEVSYRIGDSLTLVKAGKITATAYRRLEMMDSSIAIALKVLPIARRNNYRQELKSLLNGLAVASMYLARYSEALQYNFESLEIREQDGDPLEIRTTLNNIGLLYYKIKDYRKAITYYQRSLQLETDFNIRTNTLDNIALCYLGLGDYKTVKQFLNESIRSCADSCGDAQVKGIAFSSGILFYQNGCMDSARYYFNKSLKLSIETNHQRYQYDNLIYLSKISLQENDNVAAQRYLSQAEALASMESYPFELSKVYKLLISLYKQSNDFDKLAIYQSKFIRVNERVNSDNLAVGLMRVEADYLERDRSARILYQSTTIKLKEDIISIQRLVNVLAVAVACLLVILIYIYYQRILQSSKANELLSKKVEGRAYELNASYKLLQTMLDERNLVLKRHTSDFRRSIAIVSRKCSFIRNDDREYFQQIKETIDVLDSAINALDDKICKLDDRRIE